MAKTAEEIAKSRKASNAKYNEKVPSISLRLARSQIRQIDIAAKLLHIPRNRYIMERLFSSSADLSLPSHQLTQEHELLKHLIIIFSGTDIEAEFTEEEDALINSLVKEIKGGN